MRITLGDKIEIIIANARAWNKEVHNDKFYTDEIIKLFEKLIDEKQHIKNLKPATTPEDVIYNCGIVDGLQKLKEELSE